MNLTKILHTNLVHLTEKTCEELNDEAVYCEAECPGGKKFQFMNIYHVGKYGYLIDIDESAFNESKTKEIPRDLKHLINCAINAGCYTIRLDDNGQICSCLPKYIN